MCSRVKRNNEVISLRGTDVQLPVSPYRGGQVIAEELATYFQGHSRDYNAKRDAKRGLRFGVLTQVSEYEHHGKWYEMPVGKGIVTGYRQIKDRTCSWIVTNHESDSNPNGKQHPVLTAV